MKNFLNIRDERPMTEAEIRVCQEYIQLRELAKVLKARIQEVKTQQGRNRNRAIGKVETCIKDFTK